MHQSEEDAGKCQRQNRQEILEELLYRFNGWAGHRLVYQVCKIGALKVRVRQTCTYQKFIGFCKQDSYCRNPMACPSEVEGIRSSVIKY